MQNIDEQEISQRISSIHTHYETYGISGLSQAYEDFKKEVQGAEAEAFKGEAGKLVLQRIKDLENLFSTVTGNDVKDLSMFMKDSEALRSTAHFASLNAEHIRFGDLSDALSIKEFIKATKVYMNPDLDMETSGRTLALDTQAAVNNAFGELNWKKLGDLFWLMSSAPVPSTFLNGPLATQRRRVTQRSRTIDDTTSTKDKIIAQNVAASDLQDDPEQSTAHMVRLVYGVLHEKSEDEPVNLYKFFINPASFSQSVENLFYTSFLVRDGKILLAVGADGDPYIEVASTDEIDESTKIAHQVATFTYLAWQALIAKYDIKELYIPNRATAEDTEYSESED